MGKNLFKKVIVPNIMPTDEELGRTQRSFDVLNFVSGSEKMISFAARKGNYGLVESLCDEVGRLVIDEYEREKRELEILEEKSLYVGMASLRRRVTRLQEVGQKYYPGSKFRSSIVRIAREVYKRLYGDI